MIQPGFPAERILVIEVLTPAGSWSSYPPHKHDEERPPGEARLEEVYYYLLDPPDGFGIQLLYNGEGEKAFTVRSDDAAAIRDGYHPLVAAPGYRLYYLWIMAGRGRQMIPYLDPRHAWLQTG